MRQLTALTLKFYNRGKQTIAETFTKYKRFVKNILFLQRSVVIEHYFNVIMAVLI